MSTDCEDIVQDILLKTCENQFGLGKFILTLRGSHKADDYII